MSGVKPKKFQYAISNIFPFSLVRYCLEYVWRVSGGYLNDVGGGLAGPWKVSGRCLEGTWKMSGRCMESVWKTPGRCLEGFWNVSERCLERVRIVSDSYQEGVLKVLNSSC